MLVALLGPCEPSVVTEKTVVLVSPADVVEVLVVGDPGTNFVRNMSWLPSVGPSEPGATAQFVQPVALREPFQ